jgi:hypothetical protein
MGNTFYGVKIGTTVFNNEHFDEDFSEFALDKRIEASAAKYFQSRSGITVSIIPDLKEEFRGAFGYKSNPEKSLERLKPILKKLKEEDIDAVLIISPETIEFEDTPVFISGYGLAVRSFLMICCAKVYFLPNFVLLDTSTQEMVFNGSWWGGQKEIKFSKWQKSFQKFTIAEQETIKDFLNKIANLDIPNFLERNNF